MAALTQRQVRRLPQADKLLYRRVRLLTRHVARTKRYPLEARYAARRVIGCSYDPEDFEMVDFCLVILAVLDAREHDEKCGRYSQPVDVVVAAQSINADIVQWRTYGDNPFPLN